MKTLEK